MAKLNSNLVLCNVSANDNVVAARMGIGSQRGSWQTTASYPMGLPAPSGTAPTPGRAGTHLRSARGVSVSRIRLSRCQTRTGRSVRDKPKCWWHRATASLSWPRQDGHR
jgi:hypothetical protein